jgi:hypothetical protein
MWHLASELYRDCLLDRPLLPPMSEPARVMLAHRWDCAMAEARAFVRRSGAAAEVTIKELRAANSVFDAAWDISGTGVRFDLLPLEAVTRQMCGLTRRTGGAWEAGPGPDPDAGPPPIAGWVSRATRHLPEGADRVRRKQAAIHLLAGPPDDPIAVALVARLREIRNPRVPAEPDGFFGTDGFRFRGVEVRFGRAALRLRLVGALWDAEKRSPRPARPVEEVMAEVYGENHEASDGAFRQLCADVRGQLRAAKVSLTIDHRLGRVRLAPADAELTHR